MKKPTAQELWERIEKRINTLHGIALHHGTIFPGDTTLSMVQLYAKQYYEEQTKEKKERLLLCVETIICDCGEPYSETDIHDLIKEL